MQKKVHVYLTKIEGVMVIFLIFAMIVLLVKVKVLYYKGEGVGRSKYYGITEREV